MIPDILFQWWSTSVSYATSPPTSPKCHCDLPLPDVADSLHPGVLEWRQGGSILWLWPCGIEQGQTAAARSHVTARSQVKLTLTLQFYMAVEDAKSWIWWLLQGQERNNLSLGSDTSYCSVLPLLHSREHSASCLHFGTSLYWAAKAHVAHIAAVHATCGSQVVGWPSEFYMSSPSLNTLMLIFHYIQSKYFHF